MTSDRISHQCLSQAPLQVDAKSADLAWLSGYRDETETLSQRIADAHVTGALDAYQTIGCPGFLVDHCRQIVRYNQAAERLLGDGLELSHGRLRASHPPSNLALGDLIASRACCRDGEWHGDRIAVIHRPIRRPLIVRPATLPVPAAFILLIVSDMETRHRPTPLSELAATFALTTTEARLVSMLQRELPLCEAATLMNITFHTARTHLRRILAKTQTTRQQDLLMLLHRLRP